MLGTINKEIKISENEIQLLKDNQKNISAGKRTIKFLEILGQYYDLLQNNFGQKKSSQLFSIFFKVIANSIIGGGKVHSYQLNQPFNILKNNDFSKWWRHKKNFGTHLLQLFGNSGRYYKIWQFLRKTA